MRLVPVAFLLVLVLVLGLTGASPAPAAGIADEVPEPYRAGVRRALSGSNGGALRGSYEKLDAEQRKGWAFLLANMAPREISGLTEPILTEHVTYAYRARRELPWARGVPEEVFLHYVLPILSGDEKVEAWRKRFFEEVMPRLRKKGCRTLEQVAIEVNRFCGSKVSFKSTPPQDSSPLETYRRGYGRCEEEGIFFNAVARSVGLPARVASTPYWTFKASNHAWCEVYTGAGGRGSRPWHFVGACEPAGRLDQAWFSGDVKRAAVVLSRCLGTPEGDDVLTRRGTSTVINSTRFYTKTCRMTLRVRDATGKPVPRAAVALYIFNEVGNEPYQRSAFEAKVDDAGELSFDLGPGDYLVQAKGGTGVGWAVARSAPGRKATCDVVLGLPASGIGEVARRATGASAVRLVPGAGAKGGPVAVARLDAMPFAPTPLVSMEKSGTTVPLSPGVYVVQTGSRRGDAAIEVTLQVVEVKPGETVTLAIPGRFPKRPRAGDNRTGAYVLTYPRK